MKLFRDHLICSLLQIFKTIHHIVEAYIFGIFINFNLLSLLRARYSKPQEVRLTLSYFLI